MPLREDILAPIPGDNPSGIDLRYDNKLLIHDKIKEARRQDDDLAQGAWETERKTANFPLVIKIAQDALATVSKDLQVAAWLTEALLQTERYAGLRQGLDLTLNLMTTFWDTVYPVIEDGDREMRATPLQWIGDRLEMPLRSAPIVAAGYSWITWKDSRAVGYEDQAKTDATRKSRATMLESGKLAPEVVDKAIAETPKAFYQKAEKDLDGCLESLANLDKYCDEMLEDDAPSFVKLKTALTEIRHTIHLQLEKKREKEPDPVEDEPVAQVSAADAAPAEAGSEVTSAPPSGLSTSFAAEPADRRQAVASIAAAAAFLRKREPFSPAPYLLIRGLRWGELRVAGNLGEGTLLEAPSTDLRQQVKRLALAKKWSELLETGEQAMAQPGSRAWLDLQRLTVAACTALGPDYQPIANAIQSELRALLNDLPELLDATLLDDTPAANPETRAWLRGLQSPAPPAPSEESEASPEPPAHVNGTPTWLAASVDAYALAKDALAAGQEEKAFAIMQAEVSRQRSGRGRFRRTMQLIELAVAAGKNELAQPLLEDIDTIIDNHKLEAWEDPNLVASDLLKLMNYCSRIQDNYNQKQKYFERICRLDPVKALGVVL
jgi:type VI secretion system protein ImpA